MTREEAKRILKIYLSALSFEHPGPIAEAIKTLCEPLPLPSNLDEAAFSYENDLWESGFKECGYSPQEVSDAFKAGAEWMARQGEVLTTETVDELCYDCHNRLPELIEKTGLSADDRVELIVRKI